MYKLSYYFVKRNLKGFHKSFLKLSLYFNDFQMKILLIFKWYYNCHVSDKSRKNTWKYLEDSVKLFFLWNHSSLEIMWFLLWNIFIIGLLMLCKMLLKFLLIFYEKNFITNFLSWLVTRCLWRWETFILILINYQGSKTGNEKL